MFNLKHFLMRISNIRILACQIFHPYQVTTFIGNHNLDAILKFDPGGPGCLSWLSILLSHDLLYFKFEPHIGLSPFRTEATSDSLFPSMCFSPACDHSKVNKH